MHLKGLHLSNELYELYNCSLLKKDESAAKMLLFRAYLDNRDIWFELLTCKSEPSVLSGEGVPEWFKKIKNSKLDFKRAAKTLLAYSSKDQIRKLLDSPCRSRLVPGISDSQRSDLVSLAMPKKVLIDN
jgi:hypothetical protein